MFVPIWLIAATLFLILVLVALLFRRGGTQDMIEQQRQATPPPAIRAPAPGEALDEQRVMALPQVRDAMVKGNKIEAIGHVRTATGLGLKESKQLVERHWR